MSEEGFAGVPVEGMGAPFLEDLPESPEPEETATEDAAVDILAKAKEYGELNERKRQLEADLLEVKADMKIITEAICDKMIMENPNIKVCVGTKPNGKPLFKTVYVKTQIWAGYVGDEETGEGKQELMEAMKICGLQDMVKENFNTQTLSGYVRNLNPDIKDLDELKKLVPEAMQPHLKLSKTISLAVK